jgi:hypothetical protein
VVEHAIVGPRGEIVRRGWWIAVVAVLAATGCRDDDGDRPASTTEPPTEEATATLGPLVSGTSSVVDGTFVWTDYAYDDRGADTEPGERSDPDAAGGDAIYANGWRNEADLIQSQLELDDGRVHASFVLETLTDPAVPVVVLAFDTDGDPATGAVGLGAAWTPGSDAAQGLGVDRLAVLRQDGGEFLVFDAGTFGEPEPLETTVDAEANVIEATLPLEPEGATWRAWGAAGTADGSGSWFDGDLTLADLAFLGDEPEYRWQDDIQADLLAGEDAMDQAMAEVDFGALEEGGTELADATTPGFHTYLYESELKLGEGVAEAEEGLEYRGPYQPYLAWIPDEGVVEDEPMTVFLHGLTQNHLGSVISPDGAYLGTGRPLSEEVHLLGQYASDGLDFPPHNLTVWPLARGEGLGYRGIAEQDVLDVLADATERFAPDPDRIILSGGSMGGIGTFRLGALYPDRFSVAAPIIGFAAEDGAMLDNLGNLPIRQINGAMDPLIESYLAEETTDELAARNLPFRAWMLDERGHEAGGFVYDCVYAELPELERVTAPDDITYTVDPDQFVSDLESGLELFYDSAYWVSGMVVTDESSRATVEAHSITGDGAYAISAYDRRGESGPAGGDLCGPNPDVSTGDTWRERGTEREPMAPAFDGTPTLTLDLTNLAAVTIDLVGADLADGGEVVISTDTPADVTLTELEPGTSVTVADESLEADDGGTVTLAVDRSATATF